MMALATKILRRDATAPNFDLHFHYCRSIGRLKFLENITCPYITYATHQCAGLSENPRAPHGAAVEYLVKYLVATKNDGLILFTENTGLYYHMYACISCYIHLYVFNRVCMNIALTFTSTLGGGDVKGVLHHSSTKPHTSPRFTRYTRVYYITPARGY